MIERIGTGVRASDASIHAGVAYFAMTPERPYDVALAAADQMRQVLAKVDRRLEGFGGTRSDLIFVTIVLADMASLAEVNAVWDAWIDPASPPTRACIEAGLASPAMRVELLVQARVPPDRDGRGRN